MTSTSQKPAPKLMVCKHCGKPIEPCDELPCSFGGWSHAEGKLSHFCDADMLNDPVAEPTEGTL